MDKKGFVEGIKSYIAQLTVERRFSTAKSYKDAWHSFVRYRETEDIPYSGINKESLRLYECYLEASGCSGNTISTYMRRLRCIYNQAVERDEAEYIPNLFRDVFTGIESKSKKSLSIEDQHRLMTVFRTFHPKNIKAWIVFAEGIVPSPTQLFVYAKRLEI